MRCNPVNDMTSTLMNNDYVLKLYADYSTDKSVILLPVYYAQTAYVFYLTKHCHAS
jgi:hypothetical protein